ELLTGSPPREGPTSDVPSWAKRGTHFHEALADARLRPEAPAHFASPLRVVYLDHTAPLSGGELALLRLLPSIVERGVEARVILGEEGPLVDELRSVNVEVE